MEVLDDFIAITNHAADRFIQRGGLAHKTIEQAKDILKREVAKALSNNEQKLPPNDRSKPGRFVLKIKIRNDAFVYPLCVPNAQEEDAIFTVVTVFNSETYQHVKDETPLHTMRDYFNTDKKESTSIEEQKKPKQKKEVQPMSIQFGLDEVTQEDRYLLVYKRDAVQHAQYIEKAQLNAMCLVLLQEGVDSHTIKLYETTQHSLKIDFNLSIDIGSKQQEVEKKEPKKETAGSVVTEKPGSIRPYIIEYLQQQKKWVKPAEIHDHVEAKGVLSKTPVATVMYAMHKSGKYPELKKKGKKLDVKYFWGIDSNGVA